MKLILWGNCILWPGSENSVHTYAHTSAYTHTQSDQTDVITMCRQVPDVWSYVQQDLDFQATCNNTATISCLWSHQTPAIKEFRGFVWECVCLHDLLLEATDRSTGLIWGTSHRIEKHFCHGFDEVGEAVHDQRPIMNTRHGWALLHIENLKYIATKTWTN